MPRPSTQPRGPSSGLPMDRSGCPTGLGVGRHRFVGPVRPAHPRRTASRLGPCPMRGLPMGRPPSPMRCFHHPFGLGLDHRCASSRHRTHPGDAAPLSPVQPPGRHGLEFGPSTSRVQTWKRWDVPAPPPRPRIRARPTFRAPGHAPRRWSCRSVRSTP